MDGTLEGITVLDLSWILSGPFCTMLLADQGARVIKIERPGVGDGARGTGPFVSYEEEGESKKESAYFTRLNRNKESVTLNLLHPEGRRIFLQLVKEADVVVENFTPGTMEKFGLDFQVLREANPRLIYCSISGFGQTGPLAKRPALDVIVQAMGGVMSITGEPGRPPVRVGASVGDIVAGLFASTGICSALFEREKSGVGQMLDISMLDCQIAMLENAFTRYFAMNEVPEPLGTRHPAATPFQAFETSDGWLVVAIFGGNMTQWPLFCSIIGHHEWIDDPRFQTSWDRTLQIEFLEPRINAVMKTRTTSEWEHDLVESGIPCGKVNRIDEIVSHPQVEFRQMLSSRPHSRFGSWTYINSPLRFSRSSIRDAETPPRLGEHTQKVLSEFLSVSTEGFRDLADNEIV